MRDYEPIWVQLKQLDRATAETVGISVTANPKLHKRIIKAVKKEKWKDIGFKLLLDGYVTELAHARNYSILTFFLTYKRVYSIKDF